MFDTSYESRIDNTYSDWRSSWFSQSLQVNFNAASFTYVVIIYSLLSNNPTAYTLGSWQRRYMNYEQLSNNLEGEHAASLCDQTLVKTSRRLLEPSRAEPQRTYTVEPKLFINSLYNFHKESIPTCCTVLLILVRWLVLRHVSARFNRSYSGRLLLRS